ncbi:MAG: DUF5807 family protein [Halobacteriaceae archaeon]
MSRREQFLAGERPDDVALFLADDFLDGDLDAGERVDGGTLLVVDGESGRQVFQSVTGMEAMAFAREAMAEEGRVARDLTDGDCPGREGDADGDHRPEFVFAFAEEQNPDVGGIYAEGAVIHAYVYCACGTAYSDRWVAGGD